MHPVGLDNLICKGIIKRLVKDYRVLCRRGIIQNHKVSKNPDGALGHYYSRADVQDLLDWFSDGRMDELLELTSAPGSGDLIRSKL